MTAPLRLAVFDVDGTLIDSQVFILEAMTRGFEAAGLSRPSDAEILGIVGLSLPEAFATLAPDLPGSDHDRLAQLYRESFIAIRSETGGEARSPLYPGARAALERLSAREELLMGVATGKARRGLDHALASHGLEGFFHTLQTADRHPSKPHPSMLEAALGETGAEARHAAMIGDTEYDMAMAKSAGMAAIAVSWGYHDEARLRAAGADLVIESFDALDAALDRAFEAAPA